MKKLSHLTLGLILASSFVVPFFALADSPGAANGSACDFNNRGAGSGRIYNGTCVATADYPSQSNTGSINDASLNFYKNLIVGTVNNILVPVLIAIAFIVFLWGIYKAFIYNAASEGDKAEGRKFAMWGIIGFVIILSLWGIVNIVKDTLIPSNANSARPTYPTL
ncbi:MAG: pilin [Patescibacteria group bacterium]